MSTIPYLPGAAGGWLCARASERISCATRSIQEVIVSDAETGDVEQRIARLEQQDERLTRAIELLAERAAARPRRDWDALAAVIAAFIGLLALGVSGYTAYVQREQLRAQVWPHLTLESSNVDPDSAWHVTNVGTGPARVTAMRVVVDGAPATTWGDVERAAGYRNGEGVTRSYISRAIIPAGKQILFARPNTGEPSQGKFKDLLPDGKHMLRVTLCYCSVLDDCWVASSGDGMLDGRAITDDGCPITVAERFVQ